MTDNSKKFRIALFIPSFGGGGAELVMVQLANAIASRGWDVDLVVSNSVGQWKERVTSGVRVVDLKCRRVVYSLPKLISYIRIERPTVLLSSLMRANVVAILANLFAGKICRVFVREASAKSTFPGRSNFREKVLPSIASMLYPCAEGVVALNAGVRHNVQSELKVDESKVHIIPNPIDYKSIRDMASESANHEWFADSYTLFIAVGRLEVEKGFDVLLRAFSLVKEARNESVLLILGEGSKRSELKALIADYGLKDCVQLLGFVSNPFPFIKSAKVLVQSSRIEGFPNVIVQALALNTRVVSSDSHGGGAREVLGGGLFGSLVPVDRPDMLAAAMLKAAFENDSIERKEALDSHLRKYEFDVVVSEYLDLLSRNSQ